MILMNNYSFLSINTYDLKVSSLPACVFRRETRNLERTISHLDKEERKVK